MEATSSNGPPLFGYPEFGLHHRMVTLAIFFTTTSTFFIATLLELLLRRASHGIQSPVGLLNGITQGLKGLITNIVYAISSATTQFTKTAHKGIASLTFDEQAVAEMDTQHKDLESHGKGILSEFLEAEIAMGTTGVVARPMASILEANGKTTQNVRKRSSPHQANSLRIRFPIPLARELPLLPYSWEEAIEVSMLLQADRLRLGDERLINLGSPQFASVSSNPEWVIEMEIESIVHINRMDDAVNIIGSNAESSSSSCSRHKKGEVIDNKRCKNFSASLPLVCVKVELKCREEAEGVLRVLLSIDRSREGEVAGKAFTAFSCFKFWYMLCYRSLESYMLSTINEN